MLDHDSDADAKDPLISASNISVFIIRLIGLLVLVVGVFIALKVIGEAWNLYDEPQRISRFAEKVEEGSNLDRVLAFKAKGVTAPEKALAGTDRLGITSQDATGEIVFRLSYFAAWSIVFLLLLLLGRLAMAAIKTGGELALYDIQAKQFARTLLDQVKKTPPPAPAPQQSEPTFSDPKLSTPVSHKMSDTGHRRPRR